MKKHLSFVICHFTLFHICHFYCCIVALPAPAFAPVSCSRVMLQTRAPEAMTKNRK